MSRTEANIHKGQRVGVFVDVQNMYYSAKNLYNTKVNFKNILREAVRGRHLIRAIAYGIKADVKDEPVFFEMLKATGFEVKVKDLQVFIGGAKKGDWDIGIAMDMIELAPKLDTLILISGDGDFVPLLKHLKHALGCRVEVMSFIKTTSAKLVDEADEFIDMDKDRRKYLIASLKPRPRGPPPSRPGASSGQNQSESRQPTTIPGGEGSGSPAQ